MDYLGASRLSSGEYPGRARSLHVLGYRDTAQRESAPVCSRRLNIGAALWGNNFAHV